MYIQEITIEGFKSYAQRVVLPNFDPTFNAITGLNGTGKSNILDSICFVMGIKNLSQVDCCACDASPLLLLSCVPHPCLVRGIPRSVPRVSRSLSTSKARPE